MIRDRMPDLMRLSRRNPMKYHEPEVHEDVPMEPEMKVILQRAEKAQKFLLELERMLKELSLQHEEIRATAIVNEEQRKQVSATMNRFSALARKTKTVLQRMDLMEHEKLKYYHMFQSEDTATVRWSQRDSNVELSWRRPSLTSLLSVSLPAQIRIKLTLHGVLSYRLTELVKDYYSVQKRHNEITRLNIERQMSIIGRNVNRQELDRAVDEGESVPLLHGNIVDDTQISKEMRAKLKEVAFFESEILAMEKSISQLHDAFITMSTLVHEQGALVDRIAHHITLSSDYVEQSNQQLKKATKIQHKYRKKKCCIAILIVAALIAIAVIVVLAIKRKHAHKAVHHPRSPPAHPRLRRSDDEAWWLFVDVLEI